MAERTDRAALELGYWLQYVLPDRFAEQQMELVEEGARQGLERAKQNARVDTGKMRRETEVVIEPNKVILGSRAPYAKYQELGTRYISANRFILTGAHRIIGYLRQNGYR